MSVNPQPLFEPTPLATAPSQALYTANNPTRIDKMTVVNSDTGAPHNFGLYLVPSGANPNAFNQLIVARPISPADSWDVDPAIGQMLAQGDAIFATGDTTNDLVLFCAGSVIS